MVKSRKRYDKAFRLMAVELIESQNTVDEVSKEFEMA